MQITCSSVVKNIEEALVELLLPEDSLGRNSDDHQALIGSRVHVEELALLLLEVRLAGALWILLGLVQLIGNSHVHLDLDASEMHMIILVTAHQVLVAVVPEEWVSLHLDELVLGGGRVTLRVVLIPIQMVELDGND